MRFYPRKKGKNLGIGEKINFFMYGHAVSAPFKNFLQRILSNALHNAGHLFIIINDKRRCVFAFVRI